VSPIGWRTLSFVYDQCLLPAWTWRNVCYGDDQTSTLARLSCIARQIVTRLVRVLQTFIDNFGRKFAHAPKQSWKKR
jgi:hypothetical protein